MSYYNENKKIEKEIKKLEKNIKNKSMKQIEYIILINNRKNKKLKGDPIQNIMIIGRNCTIIPNNFSYENCLIKLNEKSDILIDRFDVRANLDYIEEKDHWNKIPIDKHLEGLLNYERYRNIIENKRLNIDENKCIKKVDFDLKNKVLKGYGINDEKPKFTGGSFHTDINYNRIDGYRESVIPPYQVNSFAQEYGIDQMVYGYDYNQLLLYEKENNILEAEKKQDEIEKAEIFEKLNNKNVY